MKTICNTVALMDEAVEWMAESDLISPDVETIPHMTRAKKPQPEVMTVVAYSGILKGEIRSYAFQLTQQKSSLQGEHPLADEALSRIKRINENATRKTLHNGVYDAAWFIRYGVGLSNYAYDSMTLWWSRYPDLPKTLDFVSSICLDSHMYWKQGRKSEDFTGHTMYAMDDTETTLKCTLKLLDWALRDQAMLFNFHRAHMRCLTGLSMSLKGMDVDWDMFEEMRKELESKAEQKLAALRYLIDDDSFNPNSAPAKKTVLYDLLGATPRNAKGRILKRTGGNAKISTGAIVLRGMKSEHPILRRVVTAIQDAQEPAKQISNVIGIEFMGNKFRTGYDGIGTTTERLSSRKDAFGYGGNAQNLRKKFRRFIRAYAKSSGRRLFIFELDFSAADDVFVSYESGEQKKIDVIERGLDTHAFNVSEVFFPNWTYERVVAGKREYLDEAGTISNPDYVLVTDPITGVRQIVKKTTHGCNYLMAGHTLLNSAGREAIVAAAKHWGHIDAGLWGINQLAEFCEWLDGRYRQYYPRFARTGPGSFYTELNHGLRSHGSFTTIFGYTQRFLADPNADSTLRACAATTGQANTAGRVNMAMMELDQGIRTVRFRDGEAPDADEEPLYVNEREYGTSLRLQTHDSLTFVCDADHPNFLEGVDRVFRVMRRPVVCKGRTIKIGIEADVAINWAHKVHTVHNSNHVESWVNQTFFG